MINLGYRIKRCYSIFRNNECTVYSLDKKQMFLSDC